VDAGASRYYEEMWNRWNFDMADELLAADFAFRGSLGREVKGREEFKAYMRLVRSGSSDFHNHIEQVIASDRHVVARLTYTGTHDGEVLGIAPTGRQIMYPGVALFEFAGFKLVSGYVVGDRLTLLQQILGDSFWACTVRHERESFAASQIRRVSA
jgi:steroid delta-isomerase-like uncharacterized protein